VNRTPTDLPRNALKHYQQVVAHVALHPGFAEAYRESVAHAGSADSPDATADLKAHGIALPAGAKARVKQSATDSTDPDALEMCVVIGSSLYCVEFRPPITITVE
jgi:hypothetical protein